MAAATLARLRTLTDCQVCLVSAYEDVEELLPRSPSRDIERRRAEEGGVQKRYGECRLLYAGHIYMYILLRCSLALLELHGRHSATEANDRRADGQSAAHVDWTYSVSNEVIIRTRTAEIQNGS